MKLPTFKGGVHPDDGKKLTKDCPVQTYLPKGDLVYPLSQHIGAPAKPLVKKNDTVLNRRAGWSGIPDPCKADAKESRCN